MTDFGSGLSQDALKSMANSQINWGALLDKWEKIKAGLGDQAAAVGVPEDTLSRLAGKTSLPIGALQISQDNPLGTYAGRMASVQAGARNLSSYLSKQGITPESNDLGSLLSQLEQMIKQKGSSGASALQQGGY